MVTTMYVLAALCFIGAAFYFRRAQANKKLERRLMLQGLAAATASRETADVAARAEALPARHYEKVGERFIPPRASRPASRAADEPVALRSPASQPTNDDNGLLTALVVGELLSDNDRTTEAAPKPLQGHGGSTGGDGASESYGASATQPAPLVPESKDWNPATPSPEPAPTWTQQDTTPAQTYDTPTAPSDFG